MDKDIQVYFDNLKSQDKGIQYHALMKLFALTEQRVNWTYDIWDHLIEGLNSKDNHQRSRSAQLLINLAISDPENRIIHVFERIWKVTFDSKFVTARHSLQKIWRVGLAGPIQLDLVIGHFIDRFKNCENEKNYTLIRFDIIQGMKKLYDELLLIELKQLAIEMINTIEDQKYKKKYVDIWKNSL